MILTDTLWRQFGAGIDMLENAITRCPDTVWRTQRKFFYIAYHAVVFLDYYLTIPPRMFRPPLPFTLTDDAGIPEEAVDDVVPDEMYSRDVVRDYLRATRDKCRRVLASLTEEQLQQRWTAGPAPMDLRLSSRQAKDYTVLEILLFNMRHVQHHAAQLNLLLRQYINDAPGWVSHAEATQKTSSTNGGSEDACSRGRTPPCNR